MGKMTTKNDAIERLVCKLQECKSKGLRVQEAENFVGEALRIFNV